MWPQLFRRGHGTFEVWREIEVGRLHSKLWGREADLTVSWWWHREVIPLLMWKTFWWTTNCTQHDFMISSFSRSTKYYLGGDEASHDIFNYSPAVARFGWIWDLSRLAGGKVATSCSPHGFTPQAVPQLQDWGTRAPATRTDARSAEYWPGDRLKNLLSLVTNSPKRHQKNSDKHLFEHIFEAKETFFHHLFPTRTRRIRCKRPNGWRRKKPPVSWAAWSTTRKRQRSFFIKCEQNCFNKLLNCWKLSFINKTCLAKLF